jgi:hypothetical protein
MGRLNRDQLFKRLEDHIAQPNNSKYLYSTNKFRYSMFMRDRQPVTTYYEITIKGNYIRGYAIQYLVNDIPVNLFLDVSIPTLCGESPEEPKIVKKLIARKYHKNWRDFVQDFRYATPSLDWFER